MRRHVLAVAALLLAAAGAQAAGRAEVRYIAPERYADAGFGALELERTQRVLTSHFERLARRLPDGQVLRVDVTDVDLAGEVDTLALHRVRVLGQLPDAPRLGLKFELRQGERLLVQGEERLTDLAYLDHGRALRRDEPLAYEGRLLERWFDERFAKAAPAVR